MSEQGKVPIKVPANFESWLEELVDSFHKLPGELKNQVLCALVAKCEPPQLQLAKEAVLEALHTDFIALLPAEISENILDRLGSLDLIRCRQVSKTWREVVGGAKRLWHERARAEGAKLISSADQDPGTAELYLKLHRIAAQRLTAVDLGRGVATYCVDHSGCRCSGIHRIQYDEITDTILTVSFENSVKIWSMQDGSLLAVVPTSNWISTLARVKNFVYTASFTGCIFQWQIPAHPSQWKECLGLYEPYDRFEGHGSPVLAMDAVEGNEDPQLILATADRENEIRLFHCTAGRRMTALQMLTLSKMTFSVPPKALRIINKRTWEKEHVLVLVSLSTLECSVRAVDVSSWRIIYERILVSATPGIDMLNVDVLPSCHTHCNPCPHLPRIAVAYQRIVETTKQTSLDVEIFTADPKDNTEECWRCTTQLLQLVPTIRAQVLSVGEAFLLLLDILRNDLLVYNIQKKAIVATVPLKDRTLRRWVVTRQRNWLDGIDVNCPQKIIFLACWRREIRM